MPSLLRGRQAQFYIDIVYGIVFSITFGFLLFVDMDPRVAAFAGGLVLGYFLRVWENMTVYERILQEAVAEEVAEQVPQEAEERVAREVEATVPEEVHAEAEEQVAQEVREQVAEAEVQVSEELHEEVEDQVDQELEKRINARIEERLDDEESPDS